MSHEISVFNPPNEMRQIFGNPALVGNEKIEDYERLWASIASAIKPTEFIGWLLTKDVTHWSWEIKRERTIKAEIIKYYQREVVAELLKSTRDSLSLYESALYRIFEAGADLTRWTTDQEARMKIEEALAAKGHDVSSILAQAYMRGANQIDAIDKRIAAYERRRNVAIKEAGLWSDRLLRQLDHTTSEVIEGEFTEAAE